MKGPEVLADDVTLTATLGLAVPLRIDELISLPPSERESRARGWASEAATVVGSSGDALLFGGGKRGSAANAFNHLARGLAAAAVLAGEVTFAGVTWRPPPESCWAAEPVRVPPARRPVEVVELPECAA